MRNFNGLKCRASAVVPAALLMFAVYDSPCAAQQAGGVAASGPQVRMVRAVVGAKGEARNGTYVMTDRRTTFHIPDDREVIVYFEWEGPQGKHHCEASVRGPNGEFSTMSSFDYTASQPRFGGYWKMPLSESTPPGNWVFESKVDGESAGQATFQVVPGATPANQPKEAPLPSVSELYKLATASSVQIEKLDPSGKVLLRASGFIATQGHVITTFRAIDGATSLHLGMADGHQVTTDRVLAWSRRQDWAILGVDVPTTASLKIAELKSWNVGDPCYWLDAKNESSRILLQGEIVGLQTPGSWGDRIDISGTYNAIASGGPLLNERGQVIGILGGILPESLVNGFPAGSQAETPEAYYFSNSGTSVAISLLPQTLPAQSMPLSDLWAKGAMMPPVTNSKYVLFGLLSQVPKIAPKAKTVKRGPADMKVIFRRSDATATAIITFSNNESLKTTAQVNIYDVDNHPVATGTPEKLTVNRGELAERLWQFPISGLPVGFYRFDLVVADGVAWRQYFKLTD